MYMCKVNVLSNVTDRPRLSRCVPVNHHKLLIYLLAFCRKMFIVLNLFVYINFTQISETVYFTQSIWRKKPIKIAYVF